MHQLIIIIPINHNIKNYFCAWAVVKPHCQYFATDVASEHPASIEPAATHHSSPSFLAQSRMPQQTVNSFDLEVGNSLDQALHQVLNSHTKSSKC